MSDTLLVHAREFTTIEVQGLTLWNELQDRGETTLALELLDAALMHEHYTSLLPHTAAERSTAQIVQQAHLRGIFDSIVQQATLKLKEPHAGDKPIDTGG